MLREVTLPVLFPGIFSGCLFAFLLSWGNFPLSLYTTGADTTVPEFLYAKMVAGYTPGRAGARHGLDHRRGRHPARRLRR